MSRGLMDGQERQVGLVSLDLQVNLVSLEILVRLDLVVLLGSRE